ncbi:MAG: carboxymuconolactone decarboxylase family protein [Gemmatimonadetes bacterium]|nr:carboxymuconolactone decarboxylase family protein [Gemmatimonadota bacterium]
MEARIEYSRVVPQSVQPLVSLHMQVRESGLEPALLELVKVRASQINGCGFCIDQHTRMARAAGETEQRLYAVSAWWEFAFFTERERAALAWAEAVTRVADGHVPDAVYQTARTAFSEDELISLTLAVVEINAWNRLATSLRWLPES